MEDGRHHGPTEVPLRNAMNEVLRDEYVRDNEKGIEYWNRICEKHDVEFRFRLPHRRFHRKIGVYAGANFDVEGNPLSPRSGSAASTSGCPAPRTAPT